jgi:hypothetical protein
MMMLMFFVLIIRLFSGIIIHNILPAGGYLCRISWRRVRIKPCANIFVSLKDRFPIDMALWIIVMYHEGHQSFGGDNLRQGTIMWLMIKNREGTHKFSVQRRIKRHYDCMVIGSLPGGTGLIQEIAFID